MFQSFKILEIILKRYISSILGFIWLFFKLKRNRPLKKKVFKELSYISVHIVLPGPTGDEILNKVLNDKECIIFVNHAIKLAKRLDPKLKKFSLLFDTTRAVELIKNSSSHIKNTISIFCPYNFFHLRIKNIKYLSNFSIYLMPKLFFNPKYGFECIGKDVEEFKALEIRPCGYGFGSLCFSLQMAYLLKPKKIFIYGCNFGKKANKLYFDKSIPIRSDTPHDLIRSDFYKIKNILQKQGISIEMI